MRCQENPYTEINMYTKYELLYNVTLKILSITHYWIRKADKVPENSISIRVTSENCSYVLLAVMLRKLNSSNSYSVEVP